VEESVSKTIRVSEKVFQDDTERRVLGLLRPKACKPC